MQVDWYAGVCDRMLTRLAWWGINWPHGEEFATRQKVNLMLERGVEDIVVKRLVKIPFRADELDHLVRILDIVAPKEEMTAVFHKAKAGYLSCRMRSRNERLVPIASYAIEAKEVFEALLRARDGETKIESRIAESLKTGKPLWDS
jgi:hypothetical protein